jgi:Flp pilus assembly protein TadD
VTLLALFCGAALLIAGRSDGKRRTPPVLVLAIAAVVGIAGLVGLAGNIALAQAGNAARAGDWSAAARHARRAETWAPWSAQPWQQLGEAELGEGNLRAAVRSFNTAIDKSPGDWSIWFDLARSTGGRSQRNALDHAARLNPLSPEIVELRSEIAAQQIIQLVRK